MMTPIDFNSFFSQVSVFLLVTGEGHENVSLIERILESNAFNVILVALILGYLAKKFNLAGAIDGQRNKVATEIQSIESRKRQAQEQLDEAKRLTANLKSEVDEILNNARQSAEALSAQILSDAKSESVKIVENAKKRVELEQRAAIKDLEKRLLNDALLDARAEMAGSLNQASQKRSIEAFLDELSQMKEGSR